MYGTLTVDEIDDLLLSQSLGHLGCTDCGKPYIVPMAYVYDGDVIYGQTTEGKKVDILRRNSKVCFQVQETNEAGWKSAECWGTFQELQFSELQDEQAMRLVKLLTDRLGSIQKTVGIEIPFSFENGARPSVKDGKFSTLFRIIVDEKTGRMHDAKGAS